ncbi:MAG: hypothetical protein FJX53_10935, partial [Alphaproteobacteria bacterium]|nr:hypothetical protein [Alphaproteobacteria bacterium]
MIDRLVPPQRELGIFRPQPLLRLAGIALGVVLLAWAFLVPGDDASDEAHPATEVERAYAAWTATPPDREDALGTLRVHALGQPPDRVARGLVAARENGWDTAFVDQFTAIVAWAVSVRASAPDTVHAQAERALASADAVTVEVGEALLAVAAQKGHLAARLTAAQRRLDAGDAEAGRLGLITLAAANDF